MSLDVSTWNISPNNDSFLTFFFSVFHLYLFSSIHNLLISPYLFFSSRSSLIFVCNRPVLDEMPKLNKAYSYENQWENTKRNMEKKGERVCLKWRGGQNSDNICKLHQLLYSDYRFSTQVIIKQNKAKKYSPSWTKRVYVGPKDCLVHVSWCTVLSPMLF